MRVLQVVVKQVKQIRQYEPETIELTIELGPKDKVSTAVAKARETLKAEFARRFDLANEMERFE